MGLRERHTGRTRGIAITVRDYSGQLPDLRGRTLIFPLRQRVAEPCRAYPELFVLLGGQVPDLRGLFLRGYGSQTYAQNNGSTVGITSTMHSSGTLGLVQGDGTRNVTGTIGPSIDAGSSGIVYRNGQSGYMLPSAAHYATAFHHIDISRVVPVANENRPVNTAVRYLIRAKP